MPCMPVVQSPQATVVIPFREIWPTGFPAQRRVGRATTADLSLD